MIVYMDLENLLKEKHISKNKLCEACNLQRTQLNNYCKNKVTRIDFTILAKLCEFLHWIIPVPLSYIYNSYFPYLFSL